MKMDMDALVVWLKAEMERQDNMTVIELERRSGISDSTLKRILYLEVDEVIASQLAQLAKGLKKDFWYLMQIAGFPPKPGDPSAEAAALAVTLESQADLQDMMRKAARFAPADRDAILEYMEALRKRKMKRRKKPRSPEGT
jgi:transcriptional regulator with XRE-family HTH domain